MFLSVVFFITGLLGFLTLTVVVTQYKWNRKVNFYLLVLFLVASCRFFFNGIQLLIPFSIDDEIGRFFRSFGCIIFPCIYLYFKNLLANKKNVSIGELRHFVVPVSFGFLNILVLKYTPFLHPYCYFLFCGIAVFYLMRTYFELKKRIGFRKSGLNESKQRRSLRNWAVFLFVVCAFSISRLVVTLLLDVYISGFSRGTSYLWISAVLNCVIFFKFLLTSDVLLGIPQENIALKKHSGLQFVFEDLWILSNEVSCVDFEDLQLKQEVDMNLLDYIQKIENKTLSDFCFRNTVFTMNNFARELGISKSHLLCFFKYHSQVSFVDFKKIVRIYDAINLLNEGYFDSNSLDLLSRKVGFSGLDSFSISFKEVTGVFPEEFVLIEKEEYYGSR